MATVFDVAKYILEKTDSITANKLQKLCYYAQVWHLAWENKPLFDEDFPAWVNGPVCKELFDITKDKFFAEANDEPGDINNLDKIQKEDIDKVIEYYGNKTPQWLSQLTQMEDPWQNARKSVPIGTPSNKIISKESMLIYYKTL